MSVEVECDVTVFEDKKSIGIFTDRDFATYRCIYLRKSVHFYARAVYIYTFVPLYDINGTSVKCRIFEFSLYMICR